MFKLFNSISFANSVFFCLVVFLCVQNGGWDLGREGVWFGVTACLSNNYRTKLSSQPKCSAGVETTKMCGVSV